MSFTTEQIADLSAPLSRENVSTRSGAGSRQLSYIESHHAIREANRIFGFDGWSSETVDLRVTTEKAGEQHNVSYMARVRITVFAGERVIVREGVGAGHGRDRDAGQAHEKACKEAESDAQKRALRQFGDQFGLALYDKAQEHVADAAPAARPAQSHTVTSVRAPAQTDVTPPIQPKAPIAQERPSKPSAPSAKPTDWQDRERKILEDRQAAAKARTEQVKASATNETELMAARAADFLGALLEDLKGGGNTKEVARNLAAWKETHKVNIKRYSTAQKAKIDKAGFALRDALDKIAQTKINPDTGEVMEDAA